MAKGCNVGNQVILGPTGTFPYPFEPYRELYNGQTLIVLYNGMIKEQGKCYIVSPYGFNLELCKANNFNGAVINFQESQVSCEPIVDNIPIDNSIALYVLAAIFAGYCFYLLKYIKHSNYA